MLDESGKLLINGTAQNGEILYPTYAEEGLEYPLTVPENHVFILGDYRTQTVDSRDLGRYRWSVWRGRSSPFSADGDYSPHETDALISTEVLNQHTTH